MTGDTHAFEEPCWIVGLKRDAEEGEDEYRLAEEALVAVHALTGDWLEPLAWEITTGCYDTEMLHAPAGRTPPQPHWLLRKEHIPLGVRADDIHAEPVQHIEPEMTLARMKSWMFQALEQPCEDDPRFISTWLELMTLSMRVRLPDHLCAVERENFVVSCYAGNVPVPYESSGEKRWVSGPLDAYVFGPPAELVVRNEDELAMSLRLQMYWDLWSRDLAGRAQVDAAVERVLALGRGWRRSAG